MKTKYEKIQAFRGNYTKADYNFVIQNLPQNEKGFDRYYGTFCVLENIIARGKPSSLSIYLAKKLKITDQALKPNRKLSFLSVNKPRWNRTIRGDLDNNKFPAETFFYQCLNQIGNKYPCVQNLILPEAFIEDIISGEAMNFRSQQVDFYCDLAKLVIEIDGSQHSEKIQRAKDYERNHYLQKNNIHTVRIKVSDLDRQNEQYQKALNEIAYYLSEMDQRFWLSDEEYFKTKNAAVRDMVLLTGVFRFQILILELLKSGKLKITDPKWRFAIKSRDATGFEEIAIKDIFLWLANLFGMRNIKFEEPEIEIQHVVDDLRNKKYTEFIRIDFSIFKTWDDTYLEEKNIIYVRNAFFQNKNYFQISQSDLIKYDIFRQRDLQAQGVPKELIFILKNIYGFDNFREGQAEIIANALCLRDTIGLLPTGSGKSACFQISALLQPCISICIVPIKALMSDQIDNLRNKGMIRENMITSDLTGTERGEIQQNFVSGNYQLLFVSPERFQSAEFRKELDLLNKKHGINIGYAIIDEAHCLSEWGHSFRTSYLNLVKTIRKYCPTAVLLGLTATASVNTLKNIQIEFGIKDRKDIITCGSYTRDELTFDVIKSSKNGKYYDLIDRLNNYKRMDDVFTPKQGDSRCGLIFTPYVNGREGCYQLSGKLEREFKSRVEWYAGSAPKGYSGDKSLEEKKTLIQREYKDNKFTWMVATKAFGMGIDKPNIWYTIHYGLPSSMEALYQEAGRAGRDKEKVQREGIKAKCTVIYEPELLENEKDIEKIFLKDTTVDELNNVFERACPSSIEDEYGNIIYRPWSGKDVYRQLFLLLNGLNEKEEDVSLAKDILREATEL